MMLMLEEAHARSVAQADMEGVQVGTGTQEQQEQQ